VISTCFGLLSIFLSNLFLKKIIIQSNVFEAIKERNVATAVFSGTMIFCVLLLTRTSIVPSVNFLQASVVNPSGVDFVFYLKAFLYFLLFFFIAFSAAVFLLFCSSKIFVLSTKDIDEMKEIENGNLAMSILISFSMLAFSFYLKPSLEHFLSGIIHYLTTS
jgi:uncharacterized membrane protein YjfL (UPF0719 family)